MIDSVIDSYLVISDRFSDRFLPGVLVSMCHIVTHIYKWTPNQQQRVGSKYFLLIPGLIIISYNIVIIATFTKERASVFSLVVE